MHAWRRASNSKRALDPREAVVDGLAHGLLVMGVAAVEAGLAAVISCAQLLDRHAPLAEPELPLRGAAREDDVRELFDLLADRRVGGLPHARRAVSGAASDGDQDVLLRPFALLDDLAQLVEVDLELRRAVPERRAVVGDRWIGALAELDQFLARAVEAVVERVKLQALEDALHLGRVIGIFGADQQVEVHEARLRRHVEAQLDVREEQLHAGQAGRRPCACRNSS